MNKDDKECTLLSKYSDLPNDLSEALSKHQDEDKAFYYGAFNKQDFFTFQGMQKFRIGCTILNTPIWLVALLVKGWAYFLMYGTQWTAVLTTFYFMICWQAANKEDELERKLNAYRGFDPEDGPGYSMQIKEEQHLLEPDKVAAIKHALAEAEYWNYVACRAQHITVAWQYSIVWVFWLFVGPVFFTTNMLWNFGLVFAHIVPAILVIIHFHLGKSRIRLRDFLISFLITSVYVFVNFAFCKVTGVPVYPFMTWTSSICLLYSLGCWLIGQVCMGFSTLFQEWRHGRSYNKCI